MKFLNDFAIGLMEDVEIVWCKFVRRKKWNILEVFWFNLDDWII
jgi:hypothetical protein